jgi:hypothetical protein
MRIAHLSVARLPHGIAQHASRCIERTAEVSSDDGIEHVSRVMARAADDPSVPRARQHGEVNCNCPDDGPDDDP